MNNVGTDRRFAENGRKYQIQKLWDVHHEICRMAILGLKHTDIARLLGVTDATVSTCLNSQVVKEHMHIMRMARDASAIDVKKRLEEMAPKATQVLDDVLDGMTDATTRLKVDVAKDVLDRSGHKAPSIIKGEVAHAFLTAQDIEDIKRKARESRALVAEVVE